MKLLQRIFRYSAFRYGRGIGLFRRFCQPNGEEWASFLATRGGLHAIGTHCSIQTNTVITDPAHVRLGNNVRLSGCTLFGHDGSVNMLVRAYGRILDRVGKIDIRDNVFIGHGAIVLPGVTIGPNAIVAAGTVVSRDVPENSIVAGTPARVVGALDAYVEKLAAKTAELPWYPLLCERTEENYFALEPQLRAARVREFFGASESTSS